MFGGVIIIISYLVLLVFAVPLSIINNSGATNRMGVVNFTTGTIKVQECCIKYQTDSVQGVWLTDQHS